MKTTKNTHTHTHTHTQMLVSCREKNECVNQTLYAINFIAALELSESNTFRMNACLDKFVLILIKNVYSTSIKSIKNAILINFDNVKLTYFFYQKSYKQ